jgi:hypothetical protein
VAAILARYGPPAEGGAAAESFDPEAARDYSRLLRRDPERGRSSRSDRADVRGCLLHRGVLRDGALEPKLAELLLCAVNAAEPNLRRDPRERRQGRATDGGSSTRSSR